MNAFKRGLFAAWLYGTTTLWCILLLPTMLMPRQRLMDGIRLWSRMARWGLRVICGVVVEVRGTERLPVGGTLIAAKHQSMFDIVSPYAFLTDPCFVVKKELMSIPLFGWLCGKAEMITVDREGGAQALRDLVADSQKALADGRQLIIYPEGTRRDPGAPPDYKPGIAALYRDLGLPCTPTATNAGVHLDAHGFFKRPGVIVFEVLEPIPPGLKRSVFMQTLQDRIETASNELLKV